MNWRINGTKATLQLTFAALAASFATVASAQVKIAHIDPYSGPAASVGIMARKHSAFYVDKLNAAGGLAGQKVELLALDNKFQAQETGLMVKKAIGEGARYILTGNSTALTYVMLDAITKHNERNPGKEVVLLNHYSLDPAFTGEKCSFWHFRFELDTDMRTKAFAKYVAGTPSIKKIYVINQDYAYGKLISESINKFVKGVRPDVQLVADEFVPTLKVTDFTPYIAKIKASGADTVMTSNWGNDMLLLFKAAKDAGLDVNWLAYAGSATGSVTAINQDGVGKVYTALVWHQNIDPKMAPDMAGYQKRFEGDDYFYRGIGMAYDMLAQAATKAKSADPAKVAKALEGLKMDTEIGQVTMRADNHQLEAPMYVAVYSDQVPFTIEGTKIGLKTVMKVDAAEMHLPNTCKFTDRPD